jgi:TRAP-type C4-dicarboxylate transport system permease small subunit
MFYINLSDIQVFGIELNELILTTLVSLIIFCITSYIIFSGKINHLLPVFRYSHYILYIFLFVSVFLGSFLIYEIESKKIQEI